MKLLSEAGVAGRGRLRRAAAAVLASGLWLGAAAGAQIVSRQFGPPQENQEPRSTALVTGKVMCSDTLRPARFASVMLIGAEQVSDNARGPFGRRVMARTDLDGNFSVLAEPGDYYVTAFDTGYAPTVSAIAARLPSGATEADLLAAMPQVHVAEGTGGTVNLSIERGAVISGKVQWDDGSPATGVNINTISTAQEQAAGGPNGASDLNRAVMQLGAGMGTFQTSDDRGVFRVTGLPPGSYLLRANVMTPSAGQPRRGMGEMMTAVTFYAPGKVRRSEAQAIAVKSGEERDDVLLTLDMASLHTVSGTVGGANGDLVASGFVRVSDAQDSSFSRQAQIQPDGSFTVQWVPAGSYTLSVNNASNMPAPVFGPRGRQSNDNSGRVTFQPFQESLTVTDSDISGVGISLTPITAAAQ